jgi:mRNA-degrading endonuclease toxin of MazEF toxin-antitoxin module
VEPPGGDPRRQRAYVVVSRPPFLEVNYSTAICAPIYSNFTRLETEVVVDESSGLKRTSAIRCDELTSLVRSRLTNYVGSLAPDRIQALDRALSVALGIDHLTDERR